MSINKAAENRRKLLSGFSFEIDRKKAEKIQDIGERILWWKKRIRDLKIVAPPGGLDWHVSKRPYRKDVAAAIEYLEAELEYQSETNPKDVPENSKEEQESDPKILSKECLDKLREITDKHSAWGQNKTFKEAYKFEQCKYEILNGERKDITSWKTLFRRVKKYYPKLFERTSAKK